MGNEKTQLLKSEKLTAKSKRNSLHSNISSSDSGNLCYYDNEAYESNHCDVIVEANLWWEPDPLLPGDKEEEEPSKGKFPDVIEESCEQYLTRKHFYLLTFTEDIMTSYAPFLEVTWRKVDFFYKSFLI